MTIAAYSVMLAMAAVSPLSGHDQGNGTAAPTASSSDGFVTVELSINESGTTDKCAVVETNAPVVFSDKVCSIFAARAKFKPKLDASGKAQRNTIIQTIRFKIQN